MRGPMLASWRTSSIGPNASSSAKRRSASLPVVGNTTTPPGADEGDGLAPGEPDGPGEADDAGEADAPGDDDAPAEAVGAAVGPGVELGCSARPIWSVRIRM